MAEKRKILYKLTDSDSKPLTVCSQLRGLQEVDVKHQHTCRKYKIWSKLDFQFDPNFFNFFFFKHKNWKIFSVQQLQLMIQQRYRKVRYEALYGLHRSCWVIAVTHYGATQNKWVIRSDRLKPYNPQVTWSLSAMSEPPHPSSANTFLPPHFITGLLWAV